jgi:hypothetical protein
MTTILRPSSVLLFYFHLSQPASEHACLDERASETSERKHGLLFCFLSFFSYSPIVICTTTHAPTPNYQESTTKNDLNDQPSNSSSSYQSRSEATTEDTMGEAVMDVHFLLRAFSFSCFFFILLFVDPAEFEDGVL